MKIIDPATDGVVAEVEADDDATVAAKVAAARAAQPGWAATPVAERVAVVSAFRSGVADQLDDLAATLTSETGKPITQARNELTGVLERIDWFCDNVADVLADERVHDGGGLVEVVRREPLGVVANVSAWNYPWFVGSNVFVPALLTGNAVAYKPSEHATLTGLAIARLLAEAGLPDGLFACLVGAGDVGAALVEGPVDGVFFTGSHATGVRIAESLAGRLIPVQLELGGKDPVYVTDDVPVAEVAAAVADGAFYNTGQSCCSVERIYVHRAVADAFIDAFVDTVESFVAGNPTDETTYLGPLTRAAQLDVLEAQVADAVDKGAVVRTGGSRRPGPGAWFEPTVLTDVDHTMAVMREESFGPIIGIAVVADDEEAAQLMDDTDYGLTAAVFGRDRERAERLLASVDAGSAYWNCCDRVSPRLPWTGRRHSGIGSTLSRIGIEAFTRPKALHLRTL